MNKLKCLLQIRKHLRAANNYGPSYVFGYVLLQGVGCKTAHA